MITCKYCNSKIESNIDNCPLCYTHIQKVHIGNTNDTLDLIDTIISKSVISQLVNNTKSNKSNIFSYILFILIAFIFPICIAIAMI